MKMYLLRHHRQRGAHKIKPATVLYYSKYKTGVDRSDQMLSYYSFGRKTINGGRNLFLHLFNLIVVNAHILCNKTNKKKNDAGIFYDKVAKGSLASASMEIQMHGLTSGLAGRLVGRDHFLYRNPVTC